MIVNGNDVNLILNLIKTDILIHLIHFRTPEPPKRTLCFYINYFVVSYTGVSLLTAHTVKFRLRTVVRGQIIGCL